MTENDWPVLKNAKHARFAQAVAKGKTLAAAYKEAGYAGDRGNATKLSAKPEIDARIQQITAKGAELAASRSLTALETGRDQGSSSRSRQAKLRRSGCCSDGQSKDLRPA